MSSMILPFRRQCIHVTGNIQHRHCQWFFPLELPLLDQSSIIILRINVLPQLFEHIPADNLYRLPEPWTVLDRFSPDSNSPAPSAANSSYPNDANISSSPRTASSYYNTDMLSHDGRNIFLTPAPISSPSPSPGSTSSAIQHDTVETQVYSSRGYLPQYSNRFVRSPEADPQDGLAANGNFQYQYYGNSMYHGYPEGWSDPYGPGSMREAS
ncbi:hypothetical protein ARMGADRAFT_1038505 [Armillaria gallica]|uniref:Uncharacterized protein n=1 Tax=Armillaria gallica TaxID=47427 RepID=A0A2H3CTV0_ARMGA|nr:hypothetical protein ARMGADRAFT_1038505 [Armillaria gallica]